MTEMTTEEIGEQLYRSLVQACGPLPPPGTGDLYLQETTPEGRHAGYIRIARDELPITADARVVDKGMVEVLYVTREGKSVEIQAGIDPKSSAIAVGDKVRIGAGRERAFHTTLSDPGRPEQKGVTWQARQFVSIRIDA